jgi:hypothetical protein
MLNKRRLYAQTVRQTLGSGEVLAYYSKCESQRMLLENM